MAEGPCGGQRFRSGPGVPTGSWRLGGRGLSPDPQAATCLRGPSPRPPVSGPSKGSPTTPFQGQPATPLFSPACWEPGFLAWAQSTCPEPSAQGLVPLR